MVAGGGFYFFYIHQGNKSDNESYKKNYKKKLSFMHTKRFITFFKRWVQLRVGAIPCVPNYISKNQNSQNLFDKNLSHVTFNVL